MKGEHADCPLIQSHLQIELLLTLSQLPVSHQNNKTVKFYLLFKLLELLYLHIDLLFIKRLREMNQIKKVGTLHRFKQIENLDN